MHNTRGHLCCHGQRSLSKYFRTHRERPETALQRTLDSSPVLLSFGDSPFLFKEQRDKRLKLAPFLCLDRSTVIHDSAGKTR